ncbi:MAG: hypothetical protein HC850_03895 [Rhodomicrobium sp.]|nr:hypothetical protein [Rhodomicrobium sp.]
MSHHPSSQIASDALLAGSLVSSPAWAPWLTDFNQLLTTATLVLGLILGLVRLWNFWRDRR